MLCYTQFRSQQLGYFIARGVPGLKKAVVLIFLCCLLATLLSCGGSNSTLVLISPSSATVIAGNTLQFTANLPVTWTVSGDGVINAAGFFTAGNAVQTVTVTATTTDSSRSTAIATVSVVAVGTATTTTSSSPSGIAHRVFVSNNYAGALNGGVLNIVDASADVISSNTITVGGTPTFMLQTADQSYEVVYNSFNNSLNQVTNSTETVTAKVPLPGPIAGPQSAAVVPGATSAYAAVPTASALDNAGNLVTGAVYGPNFATGNALSVGVAGARFLSLDHSAVNMLVFSQNSDSVTWVYETLTTTTSGVTTTTRVALTNDTGTLNAQTVSGTNCGFSRPVAAVFSDDDTRAYVLSSGPINGGTQAMVTVLDMSQSLQTNTQTLPATPACVQAIPVSAANVGLLPDISTGTSGTQLYVAGAQTAACTGGITGTCQQGVLTVIDTSFVGTGNNPVTNTVLLDTTAPQITPNLLPGVLTFDGTNLWIGSTGCQVDSANPQDTINQYGCLSLYFPATLKAQANRVPCVLNNGNTCTFLTDQTDDITGMVWLQPFNGRKVMYVIEGGRLVAYSSSTNSLPTALTPQTNANMNLNIAGTVIDIKAAK